MEKCSKILKLSIIIKITWTGYIKKCMGIKRRKNEENG